MIDIDSIARSVLEFFKCYEISFFKSFVGIVIIGLLRLHRLKYATALQSIIWGKTGIA